MSKLPEGVPVYIKEDFEQNCFWVYQDTGIEDNGTAMTYADRLERDKAIARAAFLAARKEYSEPEINYYEPSYTEADDYLNSPEFLELVK